MKASYVNPLHKLGKDFIPVLEWSVVKNGKASNEIREGWGISEEWTIVATDMLGDLIATKGEALYGINHEDHSVLKLVPNVDELLGPLADLCELKESTEGTPLEELRAKKAVLTSVKKALKGSLRDMIDGEVEDLKELISDWKFYQTERGKVWLEMKAFHKIYFECIGKPTKYENVNMAYDLDRSQFMVAGYVVKPDESIQELVRIAASIPHGFQVNFLELFQGEAEFAAHLRKKAKRASVRKAL